MSNSMRYHNHCSQNQESRYITTSLKDQATSITAASEGSNPKNNFEEFTHFVNAIPPAPPELTHMTENEMKDLLGSKNV